MFCKAIFLLQASKEGTLDSPGLPPGRGGGGAVLNFRVCSTVLRDAVGGTEIPRGWGERIAYI